MAFSEVDTHKTSTGGIQLEMDVNWHSKSDIELDGSMVPKIVSINEFTLVHFTNIIPGNRTRSPQGKAIGSARASDKRDTLRKRFSSSNHHLLTQS